MLDKMNILQCQELAKDVGFDSMEFQLVGPKGRLNCKWLDAYFGFFQVIGNDGFMQAKQFAFVPDVHCESGHSAEATNA